MTRLLLILSLAFTLAARADDVRLAGKRWSLRIDPATMALTAAVGDERLTIASPRPQPAAVSDLTVDGRMAKWRLADTSVVARLETDDDLLVEITAIDVGSFQWPAVASPDADTLALILPLFEGSYVPVRDAAWGVYLETQGPIDTTAGLSMPFWATHTARHTVSYVLTNAFNNELTFKRGGGGAIGWSLQHAFTRNQPVKRYGVRVHLGGPSPIEPALYYRGRVIAEGWFVSLRQKIERTPAVERLLGAAHAYLWGEGAICRDDVVDYRRVAARLVADGAAAAPSAGKWAWDAMAPDQREHLTALAKQDWVGDFDKAAVAAALSDLAATDEASLRKALGDLLKPAAECGDGFGPRLIDAFARAGLDRMWLGSPSWRGLSIRPAAVARAKELGYLVAPYDSYHSIHAPSEADTWETAQFDQALFGSGAIVKADGKRRAGFKQKGFLLSPAAARPYVERRVDRLIGELHPNAWFVDCDGFGEWMDDYAPAHPATGADDLAARRSRLDWMRDAKGLVVGTEGGSALITPSIAYAHGVMTPVIGWGDPALTRKDSKYYLGAYYPGDEPAVFFKTVPMKPEYVPVFADPAYRLPLYQVVFHDAVVATHQWGYGSLKFEDPSHARELLELLYQVPPLYHLNLRTWRRQQVSITKHYAFFSPLHRQTATMPMTAFEYLNDARTLQRTVFGDGQLELIANFGDGEATVGATPVPPRSIVALRPHGGERKVFTPGG